MLRQQVGPASDSTAQESGLIQEASLRAEAPNNGQEAQRRYYALTDRGWDVLRDELRHLDAIVEHARTNPRLRKGLA